MNRVSEDNLNCFSTILLFLMQVTVQPRIQLAVTCHRYVWLTLGERTVPK